jgi:hypothetical protein
MSSQWTGDKHVSDVASGKPHQYDRQALHQKQIQSLYTQLRNVKEVIKGVHYDIPFFYGGHIVQFVM